MPTLAKILVPVDFSERCLGAARYAKALAARFQSEITLLHVLEPMRYEFSTLEFGGTVMNDLLANRTEQARRQLDAFLTRELAGAQVRRVLADGAPAETIVRYAQSGRADAIAMPTHGYGPFRRFILGSVTAKVLHDADCPVLTGVHMEQAAAETIAFRTVMCALDLGPQSRRALEWAAGVAAALGARLALLHAVPCVEVRPGECFDREATERLAREVRDKLEELAENLAPDAEIIIDGGDPPKVVCRNAERAQADLLVIGRGSAAGIFGRLRTNAYAIIRQSPCPVVSV
ncbi:MAG: universal stress protein [Acidobacteria bacterium]|nr:universal stress protein [Acidobacteriota bacterium]